MTAIVGLVHHGRVLLGGDSAGVAGWSMTVRADPKVFTNGPYVIGYTTSFRMGQILRYAVLPAAPRKPGKLYRHMCTTWVDAVRSALKDAGWAKKESEQETGGTFLVGVAGRLFEVCADYQIGEPADGYDAVGCGADIARGALHVTSSRAPHKRITAALAAAERHSAGVRGPFTLMWQPEAA